MALVIYHNPSCATSRKVLGFIREAGIEPVVVPYVKQPLTKAELKDLLARLHLAPRAILRRRGTPYNDLGLADEALTDEALIEAMVKHPILIERPIVATETAAVLCRPPERVFELLQDSAKAKAGQGKSADGVAAKVRPKPK
ncbi:arsenate reductase (glutaredoxin) [Methylocapsa acidiphila]|uniref:arsenate reductase (glutaredoxin) n=1 Tax=Methylocapsa acidiphila TaxID=133552 RepID=UPI00042A39EF|nr:arsenate reductase (glutaredoxin) [Methylocapsa acidiphila]